MEIEEIVRRGEYKVEIDSWGGCHFDPPSDEDGDKLSLSPDFMQEIEAARADVLGRTA